MLLNKVLHHSNQVKAVASFIPATVSVKNTLRVIAEMCAPKRGYTCFPGIDTIAERAGLKRRQVFNHLRVLTQLGVLTIKHRYRICRKTNQARQMTSLYTVVVSKLQFFARNKIAPKHCTPSFNHSYGIKKNIGARNSVPFSSKKTQSSFNAERFDRENREHDQRIADMTRNKVSQEKGLAIVSDLWKMLGRSKENQ